MKCSFCNLETKKKLGFDTLFAKKRIFIFVLAVGNILI